LGGRPQIAAELRALIRRMSIENPLWGAPRIHGKLGFEVAQSSVAPGIASMDLVVVPTIGFSLLDAFAIVRLNRRDLV
jgi:hypothetical protein